MLALLLAASVTSAAFAAPSASDIASARALVAEGRKMRAAGNFPGAIEKLAAAYSLYTTPVTGHELALAYRDAGRLVEARETAIAVVKMPVEADEGKASAEARVDCSAMISELAKRVAEVTLAIDYANGTTVTVKLDGANVPMAAINEPRVLDPGAHVVLVTSTGAPDAKVDFTLSEGEHRKVDVHVQAPKESKPSIAAPTPNETPTSFTPPPTKAETPMVKSGPGWLTWVGFGVAGAGAIVGSISGLEAMSAANRLSGKCDANHVCPSTQSSDVNKLNTTSTISTVSFVLAGAGLVAAIVDLTTSATAEPRPAPSTSATSLRVSVGAGSISLSGSF